MPFVKASAVRFVDAAIPGFVECTLSDSYGRIWTFVEKVPVLTSDSLSIDSRYPHPVEIACSIVSQGLDSDGRPIVRISTALPDGVETIDRVSEFSVFADQVTQP